jgi:hypothetical protein
MSSNNVADLTTQILIDEGIKDGVLMRTAKSFIWMVTQMVYMGVTFVVGTVAMTYFK